MATKWQPEDYDGFVEAYHGEIDYMIINLLQSNNKLMH